MKSPAKQNISVQQINLKQQQFNKLRPCSSEQSHFLLTYSKDAEKGARISQFFYCTSDELKIDRTGSFEQLYFLAMMQVHTLRVFLSPRLDKTLLKKPVIRYFPRSFELRLAGYSAMVPIFQVFIGAAQKMRRMLAVKVSTGSKIFLHCHHLVVTTTASTFFWASFLPNGRQPLLWFYFFDDKRSFTHLVQSLDKISFMLSLQQLQPLIFNIGLIQRMAMILVLQLLN